MTAEIKLPAELEARLRLGVVECVLASGSTLVEWGEVGRQLIDLGVYTDEMLPLIDLVGGRPCEFGNVQALELARSLGICVPSIEAATWVLLFRRMSSIVDAADPWAEADVLGSDFYPSSLFQLPDSANAYSYFGLSRFAGIWHQRSDVERLPPAEREKGLAELTYDLVEFARDWLDLHSARASASAPSNQTIKA